MDKLTALLEEHSPDICSTDGAIYECSCGHRSHISYGMMLPYEHRAHLAEMLRELLAEVWDAGFTHAEEQADGFAGVSGWPKENPYTTKETN